MRRYVATLIIIFNGTGFLNWEVKQGERKWPIAKPLPIMA
jgi:hypothetical protein